MSIFGLAGRAVLSSAAGIGRAALLVRSVFFWSFKAKIEWRQAFIQAVRIGVDSLAVTMLTSFFTGMVLALQAGSTTKNLFNEPIYIGILVGFSMVKELGPVLTAIVVSGRAGAAIAAELGTMCVTEQIDALYTLGTNPARYLVIPRYIACLAMLPILTVFADFSGILGGFLVSVTRLDVPSTTYRQDILTFMTTSDFMHGFSKSFLFAFMIATVCCFKGLSTRGGAEGVGRTTTGAVVLCMVLTLVLDYFATAILVSLGI
ncbi:MAG: ABC transporter permease [Elusimicrobiales bacterium]|nr:ABC transporter permease [Elusimicrobiales bacterium]